MRVVTSSQMKEIEKRAVEHGLTYHRLMENAGSAAAAFIRRTFNVQGRNCLILCGNGGNGGDGFVVARKLFEQHANVLVVLVDGPPKHESAISMYSSVQLMEIPIADYSIHRDRVLEVMEKADIVVDAVYGTGFYGQLNESIRDVCRAVNDAIAAVVSMDMPTGVHSDTADAASDSIRADFTIAFDSRKPAHVLPQALEYCGRVEVVDIGVPEEAYDGISSRYGSLTTDAVFQQLPVRDPASHKGSHGRVLEICGSSRYRGAAVLAAKGALCCGAGLLTVAAEEVVCSAITAHLPEAILLPLSENSFDELSEAVGKASSILYGCGRGRGHEDLIHKILQSATCPVIIDADGINDLSSNINVLKDAKSSVILTPHPGEMARMLNIDIEHVQSDRTGVAMRFAEKHGVTVLLKGPDTVIADQNGCMIINATGNAGLAKGGSGDLLAGMIAALAAQGLDPLYAAAVGAHLHGLAADRTALRLSQYSMLPSDILDDLAGIFVEYGR